MSNIIQIPIKDSTEDEVIEIDEDNLPSGNEMYSILRQERAPLHHWIELAVAYHKQRKYDEFIQLLEASGAEASLDYNDVEKDQVRALDTLAAHYVREGYMERQNKDKRKECFQKATLLYTTADKILMYEQCHLLGRAYFCLLEGNKIEQADQQFHFVINSSPDNIPATLGKACISFQKKDFKTALFHYKKVLKMKPDCPADVRLGIGHCLVRLGKTEKARLAFERCLELDPLNVSAMACLAIMDYNTHTAEGIRMSVNRLREAYELDPAHPNPIVLNQLANHFFFKSDLKKAETLANHAYHCADTDAIRAESCFQLARCLHCSKEYEKAFRYYYQAAQMASPTFVLPLFGLGQMYIHRQEFANAIGCFEKILKVQPNNAETLKIIGSLYAHTEVDSAKEKTERRQKAREYLTRLLTIWQDDIEVFIDLAQLTECVDPQKSLSLYEQCVRLLVEREGIDVPVEITNNMASLHLNMGNYEEARKMYEEALIKLEEDAEVYQHDTSLSVTIRYNLARSLEMLCLYDDAEKMYKAILRTNQSYIDCYMRLGCLARDRGQIYESSVWFKEGMSVNQQHADAWTLIGNLHMSKHEWGPAQKKFEHIMKMGDQKDDAYSVIALGNVWLETLFSQNRNKEKDKQHADRAIHYFSKALKIQPKNMWAANGIGCVLAFKGHIPEARDIFSQVREATAEFMDVWVNIAHIYMEQKQYVAAVQMYSSAMKRFGKEMDVNLLTYLARGYYKAGKLGDCRETLERACCEQPDNLLLKFNYAFVLMKLATQHLKDDKATLDSVLGAVEDLKTSERIFAWLASNKDETMAHARTVSKTISGEQAKACADLLCQGQQYVSRARAQDEAEQRQRQKQEEEREALKARLRAQQKEKEEELRNKAEELKSTRNLYVQMTKDLLRMPEVAAEEKKSRSGGGGGRKKKRGGDGEGEEFVNDSSDMGDWERGEGGEMRERPKKKSSGRKKREKREGSASGSDEGEDEDKAERRRKRKEAARQKADAKLSAKQNAKVKSRAFLSSDESSDGGEPSRGAPAAALSGDESPPPPAFNDSDDSVESEPEPSRPRKKKAVVSDDSDMSDKAEGIARGSDDSDVGGGAQRSASDSD